MNILLTGYKAQKSIVLTLLDKIKSPVEKFLFTNNFNKIEQEVKKCLQNKNQDYIIMFGRKPRIKQIAIEMESRIENEIFKTNFPLEAFALFLKENKLNFRLSRSPGNSYCNYAYFHMLKYIYENNLSTKVIFIHIPFAKNFCELDKFAQTLDYYIKKYLYKEKR